MACRASKVITAYILLLLLSVILTYGLTVGCGHANAFIPYIGFLGDQAIESTVFTQVFVIVAVAFVAVVQVHYVSVGVYLERRESPVGSLRANAASLYVGYIAASALFVLACFQESHAFYVHHIAEVLYLFDSVLYSCLHTFISMKEKDRRTGVRFVLSLSMVASFLMFLIGYILAVKMFDRPWEERYHWERGDGGWVLYVLSALSEWMIVVLFQCYLLTCYPTLRRTLLTKTSIIVLREGL